MKTFQCESCFETFPMKAKTPKKDLYDKDITPVCLRCNMKIEDYDIDAYRNERMNS